MLTAKNGKKVNFFKNNPKWGKKGKLKENQSLFGQNGKFFKKKIYVLAFLLFKKILKFVQERKFLLNKNDL